MSAVIKEDELALVDPNSAPIVVVGSGPVGVRAVQELSRRMPRKHIVWYGAESSEPYNRVQLSSLLTGEMNLAQLTGEYQVATSGALIERRFGCPITYIEREQRCVIDGRGQTQPYSALILATGSSPRVPGCVNPRLPGVFTFRNLEDARALGQRREQSHCTVVLGGGLLGLEAARAMHGAYTKVVVIDHGQRLMKHQLDAAASAVLQRHLEELGIQIILGADVRAVLGTDAVSGVQLADREIACDTLIVATGISPNVDLARRAGLCVNRGIYIDDQTRTSDPFIHAIGECAEHRETLYGLVAPGIEQANVAASVLSGEQAQYDGSITTTRLKVVGVPVFSMGVVADTAAHRSWSFRSADRNSCVRLVTSNGRVVGAAAVGPDADLGRLQQAVQQREPLKAWQLMQFLLTGRAWPQQEEPTIAQWPAPTVVCQCMGVTRGQLSDAVNSGCKTVAALSACTGASTGCGSCKPLLEQLIQAQPTAKADITAKPLLWLSGAAALLAVFFLMPWSIPYPDSITGLPYDALWREDFWKQTSGYTLLGLSVVASLLSARKRLRNVRLGNFAWWRLVHVGLGVLCLMMLVAHTGGRLGSGINFVLSLCFLAPALMGVMAGSLIAKEHELGAGAVTQRRRRVWLHILMFWPLPALLSFHILQSYLF